MAVLYVFYVLMGGFVDTRWCCGFDTWLVDPWDPVIRISWKPLEPGTCLNFGIRSRGVDGFEDF